MRLVDSAHTLQPWRIHEIAPDFRLEDVWALPTPGGPGDFPKLVEGTTSMDFAASSGCAARALFALRFKLGEILGWDDPAGGIGARVPTLRDRLPDDLRDSAERVEFSAMPFEPLYVTENELAGEIANKTMHGIIHLGWVEDHEAGGHRGQLAVLVKRNGLFGAAYMAAIAPFRHLIVYPPLLRGIGREWRRERRYAALDRTSPS